VSSAAVSGIPGRAAASVPPPRRRRRWSRYVPDAWFGAGMAAPALAVTLALIAYPLGYSLWVSLHEVTFGSTGGWRWVGLQNFVDVVNDPLFWPSMRRTLLVAAGITVLTPAIGLVFALALNRDFRGRTVLRGILILPWSLSQVLVALMVGWIFDSTFGPLNGALKSLGLIDQYVTFFASGSTVLMVIVLAMVWSIVPYATLLFLAALQTVPEDLNKAACVDGAGALRRFVLVTLPALRETLLVVVILASLTGFLVFAPIYILTGGGPGTDTTLMSWWGYSAGFRDLDLGKSAAIFYVMTMLIAIVALLTTLALGRRRDR
jgi:ABC-type sugar transport system permease subunit